MLRRPVKESRFPPALLVLCPYIYTIALFIPSASSRVPLNSVPPIITLCIAGGDAHAASRFCRMAMAVVLSCCSLVHYRPSFPFSSG